MKIPVTKPYLTKDEEEEVIQTLRSGWLVQGPKVAAFEEEIAKLVGAKYAIATSSCTTALHLALLLLGVGPGDEVIVPSFTFIATPNSILYTGAKPVFADVKLDTYNIDPNDVIRKITKHTKAIIPVHQVGLAAQMGDILNISKKYNLFVIEDAACALGAKIGAKHVGTFGEIGCFSFHPRKSITTAEGGMIVTNNKDLAENARILRAHGMSISDRKRHESKTFVDESYDVLGYNYRMSDIHAAIGLAQLSKLPIIIKKRVSLVKRYTEELSDIPFIVTPFSPLGFVHTFQSYVIRLTENSPFSREDVMNKLLKMGISTRIGIKASHEQGLYRKKTLILPNTEFLANHIITLPLYASMTKEEQDYVINCVHAIFKKYDQQKR